MRGRKPKPVEVRIAEGNPGKRPLPEPVLIEGRVLPQPPAGVSDDFLEVWNLIVPKLYSVGLLDGIDGLALTGLVTLVIRAQEAGRLMDEHGPVIFGEDDKGRAYAIRNPAAKLELETWAQVRAWMEHYGLTPLARTRLGLAELQRKSLAEELKDKLGIGPPPPAELPPAPKPKPAARKKPAAKKPTTRRRTKPSDD